VPGAGCAPRRAVPVPDRAASGRASGTHTAVSSPARCSLARLAASRRSVLTRSPARFGISEGATTTHSCPPLDQAALDAIPAGANRSVMPSPPSLPSRRSNRRRRVRNPAVLPHLAAQAARRHRDDNAFLVNIEPNRSDTICQDPSPVHEARPRPTPRNRRYLHTVRRVGPVLRRTCGRGGYYFLIKFRVVPW
jgi:hypothetical protein